MILHSVHWLFFSLFTFLLSGQPPWQQGFGLLLLAIFCWATPYCHAFYRGGVIPVIALALGCVSIEVVLEKAISPIISLFLFGFIFAVLFHQSGLGEVVKAQVMRLSQGSVKVALAGFALSAFVFSMVVTNVASVAVFFPLAMALAPHQAQTPANGLQKYIGVLIVLSATLGGVSSVIGSSTSLIVAGLTEQRMDEWLSLMLPLTLILWLLGALAAIKVFQPSFTRFDVEESVDLKLSPAQRSFILLSVAVLVLWLLGYQAQTHLGRLVAISVPLLAIWPLSVLCRHSLPELASKVQWSVFGVFISALILSSALKNLGVMEGFGLNVLQMIEAAPSWLLIAALVLGIMTFTEFVSNSATVAIWGPLLVYLALPLELSSAQLAVLLTLGASSAYVLPSSTPGNAIIHNAGIVAPKEMATFGHWMKPLALLVIVFGLVLWAPRF